ncbi:hypothetical protein B0J14DRAFT_598567, partial [Halenospora varia]
MNQPSSFHLFPDLPAEIRLQIWSYLIPSPSQVHTLSIFDAQFYGETSEEGYVSEPWSLISASRRPSWEPFQSCREARVLAKTYYSVKEWIHEIEDEEVGRLKEREDELNGAHLSLSEPRMREARKRVCCSSTDLVVLQLFEPRIEIGKQMRVQVEGEKCRSRYSGIRYLAFWEGDVEGWDKIHESMFDGLDVVFILGACRSTMLPAPGSQVLVSAPWNVGKHTCTHRKFPVVLQEHCNEYVSKDLYVSTEETLFEALRVKLIVEKTKAKAVVSVCCVRGAMDMIERLVEKNEGRGSTSIFNLATEGH